MIGKNNPVLPRTPFGKDIGNLIYEWVTTIIFHVSQLAKATLEWSSKKDLVSNVLTVDGPDTAQALNSGSNISWPPEPSSGDRGPASDSQQDAQSQDQTRASHNPDLYSSGQYISQLPPNPFQTQSIYNSQEWFDENWSFKNSGFAYNSPLNPETPQIAEPPDKAEPYDRLQSPGTFVPNPIACRRPDLLVMPAQTNDLPPQEQSPCLSRSTLSPSAPAYPASTSSVGSPNTNHKVKMEAARMEDGLLHCTQVDCVMEPRVFSRRCEFT